MFDRGILYMHVVAEAGEPYYLGLAPEPSALALGVLPRGDGGRFDRLLHRCLIANHVERLPISERFKRFLFSSEPLCEQRANFFH